MWAFPIRVVVKTIITIYILNLLQLPRVGRCIHFLAGCYQHRLLHEYGIRSLSLGD
jgi:hypothetical protein